MSIAENIERTDDLMTRNRENAIMINDPSFWLSDIEIAPGQHEIRIEKNAKPNWLKVSQDYGHFCKVYPVDGEGGVFNNSSGKLPIKGESEFKYDWKQINSGTIESKTAGDCDCLIVDEIWRFIEFKTDVTTTIKAADDNTRNKAEMQLARSMTSFKEQLSDPNLPCECVLVTPQYYPFSPNIVRNINFKKKWKTPLIEVSADPKKGYPLSNDKSIK